MTACREARSDREERARTAHEARVGLQQRAARPPVRTDPALVDSGRQRACARHAGLEQRHAQAAREAPRAHPPARRGRQGGQDGAKGVFLFFCCFSPYVHVSTKPILFLALLSLCSHFHFFMLNT